MSKFVHIPGKPGKPGQYVNVPKNGGFVHIPGSGYVNIPKNGGFVHIPGSGYVNFPKK